MRIIKDGYGIVADITGMGRSTTETSSELYEEFLEEQVELFQTGREARFELAKMERDIETAKVRRKLEKMQTKLAKQNAKLNTEGQVE